VCDRLSMVNVEHDYGEDDGDGDDDHDAGEVSSWNLIFRLRMDDRWERDIFVLPMRETASDVGGSASATMSKKTHRDMKIVTTRKTKSGLRSNDVKRITLHTQRELLSRFLK